MSAAAVERQVGSTVAGKYRLIRVLGRGGMGVVYEAEHAMTRRRVAVKVLHAHHRESGDAAKRFINEAQAAGKISHPNVVEVLDAGEDSDGSLYLVLELLSGHDLATHLLRVRRMDVAETITIVAQVLQALVVAHRQGIIHRDIKPENIYLARSVTGDTQVKILDFGISKAINPGDEGPALSVTQTNTTVGTPHYMAPEQARGERNIDTRADLWAVGVVMYECLAGKVPFDGETYNDQIVRVITEPHIPLSNFDVPIELSRVVDRALEKDRNRRYARAADMLADIRQFIERHREYASVSPHLLREPAPVSMPLPSARADNPTVETQHDPAFDPAMPSASDTLRTAPVSDDLASIFDSSIEDAPTVVRMLPDEPGPAKLLPLARARTAPASPGSMAAPPSPSTVAERRRRNLIVGGVLAASAIVAGTLTAIFSQQSPPPVPAAAAMATLRFLGLPPNARIVVGNVAVASSNTAVVPRASVPMPVEISAPGFQTLRVSVVPNSDQTFHLSMQPAQAPASAPLSTAVPTPSTAPLPPHGMETPVTAPQPASAPASAPRQGTNPSARPGSQGWISVLAEPACTVSIDGSVRGRTPVHRVVVGAGQHIVRCQSPTGALRSRSISVSPRRESVVRFTP